MSTKAKKTKDSKLSYAQWLRQSAIRVARVHFVLIGVYVATVIAYDAFNLITEDALLARWTMASILLVASAIFWYLTRIDGKASGYYGWIIYGFIMLDMALASFSVYTQRGMASKSVFLYVIPIVIAALLLRRAALYMVATISVAAYSLTAIWYSVNNPSEGYKIELYGEVGFYSALLFVVAALLWGVIRSKNSDSN